MLTRRRLELSIARVVEEVEPLRGTGRRPEQVPALASVPRGRFAMAVATVDGLRVNAGDAVEPFSIQSISKVFALTAALRLAGPGVWHRVAGRATDARFDAVEQPRASDSRPANPFLNAGALTIIDLIDQRQPPASAAVLSLIRQCADSSAPHFDNAVGRSELALAFRNRAIAELLRHGGAVSSPANRLIREYTRSCSIAVSCADLATAGLFLANGGMSASGTRVLGMRQVANVNAMMALCGLYGAAGAFACRAGMPAKSGIGGGVLAVAPGRLVVAAWSPGLDEDGNPVMAMRAVERLSQRLGLSVFSSSVERKSGR